MSSILPPTLHRALGPTARATATDTEAMWHLPVPSASMEPATECFVAAHARSTSTLPPPSSPSAELISRALTYALSLPMHSRAEAYALYLAVNNYALMLSEEC
jgi:hypothetical protein